jgi:hypothetical protein
MVAQESLGRLLQLEWLLKLNRMNVNSALQFGHNWRRNAQ